MIYFVLHTPYTIFALMNITSTNLLLFSPTGTSRKLITAVADGCRCTPHVIDMTYQQPSELTFRREDLLFMAVPVYGGKVAPIALQRCKHMRGDNTPIVIMVVYGNRAYENALSQLADFVSERGFIPIAAGAFVGEHSYSTSATPIAAGRPDNIDLADARSWGNAIHEKIAYMASPVAIDVARIKPPGNSLFATLRFILFIMQQRRKKVTVKPTPIVDADKCRLCGKCAKLCPTSAIDIHDCLHTDAERCIKCCACVKGCPTKARTFATPYAPVLSQCFTKRKPPVTLL